MTISIKAKHILHGIYLISLATIIGLLLWSQPWSGTEGQTRTITVSGYSTISAEPDEYLFSPYFQVSGSDGDLAKSTISKQANQAVSAIKKLGVAEKDIKLDASSYDNWYWQEGEEGTLTAYIQITVRDKDLAQKVQDYLLTTDAKGQITSSESFSESKRSELDARAVEQAIADAKAKANTQAALLDSKLGKVVKVNPQSDSIFPIAHSSDLRTLEEGVSSESLPVLPGEKDYTQTVTVIYELL